MKFELTDTQIEKLNKWDEEYPTDRIDVAGANHTYKFIPTGIGLAVFVTKMSNGELIELDLTEYDNW